MGEGMRHPREFGGSRIRSGWMTAAIVMCLAFATSACSSSIPAEAEKNMIAASAVSADTQNYVLNPGDELQITVWKEEGLDQKVIVRPDGRERELAERPILDLKPLPVSPAPENR